MLNGLSSTFLFAEAQRLLTREIFGNVPGWARALFYLVAIVAIAFWLRGAFGRIQLWKQGRRRGAGVNVPMAIGRLVRDVLLQHRIWGRGAASVAHVLLFSGFVVLTIGTILISIEHILADLLDREAGNPVFHKGVYFGVYELVMDTFGVALLAGCVMFLVRRWRGEGSFAKSAVDVATLVLLIVIGLTGYVVEGLRI